MAVEKIKCKVEVVNEILIADVRLGIKEVFRLESRNNKHKPAKSSSQLPCLCSGGQRKGAAYECAICDVGLCVVPCLAEYHTRVNL
jgi:hypothetical protein